MRLLTELSGHIFWGLIIGIGYYKYTVKSNVESIKHGVKRLKEANKQMLAKLRELPKIGDSHMQIKARIDKAIEGQKNA